MRQSCSGAVFSQEPSVHLQPTFSPAFHQSLEAGGFQSSYRRWTSSCFSPFIPLPLRPAFNFVFKHRSSLFVRSTGGFFFCFFFNPHGEIVIFLHGSLPCLLSLSSTVSFLPAQMMEFAQPLPPCVSHQHPSQQYAGMTSLLCFAITHSTSVIERICTERARTTDDFP